jgi:hypothetical protein
MSHRVARENFDREIRLIGMVLLASDMVGKWNQALNPAGAGGGALIRQRHPRTFSLISTA